MNDRLILRRTGGFPYNSASPSVNVRTTLDGNPAILRGVATSVTDFRVDEVWIGVADIPELVTEVSTRFEHLSVACTPTRRGAARMAVGPITLPALDGARSMSMFIEVDGESLTIAAKEPAPLDEFEVHLLTFQDLLTFLVDEPSGREVLRVKSLNGEVAQVHERVRFPRALPAESRAARPFVSLIGAEAALGIERWWSARKGLRPVTEMAAALCYAPSVLVESDLAVSAAALDRLLTKTMRLPRRFSRSDVKEVVDAIDGAVLDLPVKTAMLEGVKSALNSTPLRTKIEELVRVLGPVVLGNAYIDGDKWVTAFMETRNAIAHGAGHDGFWTNQSLLRATRRANRIMLILALLQHLGASGRVLSLAATDLGDKHAKWHRRGPIFDAP